MYRKGTRVIVLRDPEGVVPVNMIGTVQCTFKSVEDDSKDLPVYGVEFARQFHSDLHTLRGKIEKRNGWYFKPEHIKKYEEPKEFKTIKDPEAKQFYLLQERFFTSKESNLRSELNYALDTENSIQNDIESYERSLVNKKTDLVRVKERTKQLEETIANTQFKPLDDFALQIKAIEKNKKVERIEFIDHNVRIYTKELTYTHRDDTLDPFILGRFVINFDLLNNRWKICNISNRFRKNNHHPCIQGSMQPCLGPTMNETLKQYIREGDLSMIIASVISYIEKPDYENPYTSAGLIQFAQPIPEGTYTIDEMLSGLSENIPWDETLYELTKAAWIETHPDYEF